jgi:queuosine precursor transporter
MKRLILTGAYLGVIVAANAALSHWGIVHFLGIGALMVPAGVYFAGMSFGIRDALQEAGGMAWALAAIAAGSGLSWFIDPRFAVASGVAFLLSELADFAVYTPLRNRHRIGAAALSNVVGSVIDSALFLWLAFGSASGWLALSVAKAVVTVPTLLLVARRDDAS